MSADDKKRRSTLLSPGEKVRISIPTRRAHATLPAEALTDEAQRLVREVLLVSLGDLYDANNAMHVDRFEQLVRDLVDRLPIQAIREVHEIQRSEAVQAWGRAVTQIAAETARRGAPALFTPKIVPEA